MKRLNALKEENYMQNIHIVKCARTPTCLAFQIPGDPFKRYAKLLFTDNDARRIIRLLQEFCFI